MADLIERLRSKMGMTICPYDQRSPDYYTTNDTDPCKFCGTKNEEGAPDLCKGVDMRVMDEAASEIEALTAQVAALTAPMPKWWQEVVGDEYQPSGRASVKHLHPLTVKPVFEEHKGTVVADVIAGLIFHMHIADNRAEFLSTYWRDKFDQAEARLAAAKEPS